MDSNVWLETLLGQAMASEAERFLQTAPLDDLHITDFALHSIGVVLARTRRPELYRRFLSDLFDDRDGGLVRLDHRGLLAVTDLVAEGRLDFDDAYQYVAAERYNFKLISFDAHFDKTMRGRLTPSQALASLTDSP